MNYCKLLKINNDNSQNFIGQNENVSSINDEVNKRAEQIVESMFSIIKNRTENKDIPAPPSVEHTVLNDKEITDVLSYLLELQSKYFGDKIPLSQDLCKQFMWNIPRPVYEAFREARDYGIDAINPMVLFYIFCVDDTKEVIYKFIEIFVNNILNNEDWDYIVKKAEEYDEYISEDFDDNDDIEE